MTGPQGAEQADGERAFNAGGWDDLRVAAFVFAPQHAIGLLHDILQPAEELAIRSGGDCLDCLRSAVRLSRFRLPAAFVGQPLLPLADESTEVRIVDVLFGEEESK